MTIPPDAIPAGIVELSSDLEILSANAPLAAMLDRPLDEIVGEPLDALLTAPSRILFQTHVYPALRTEGIVEEMFLTLAAGTAAGTPVLFNGRRTGGEGRAAYVAMVVRIGARARWEADLLEATRALERERSASATLTAELAAALEDLEARYAEQQRAREFRDAFVGVVSHELRTPITTIYGMSHLLRTQLGVLDAATTRERLGDIHAEADRLARLTEDLLVLSRAEGGRLQVADDPLVLRHLVAGAVEAERARNTGHAIRLEVDGDLPLVLGEETYVGQVIRNLLGNATKYSAPGTTIRVAVSREDDGVAVRVMDEGPGITGAPERLFELFYRAPGTSRSTHGAGIGLFVCRELVGAMRGRTWARPLELGSEFGFWLPAAPALVDDDAVRSEDDGARVG